MLRRKARHDRLIHLYKSKVYLMLYCIDAQHFFKKLVVLPGMKGVKWRYRRIFRSAHYKDPSVAPLNRFSIYGKEFLPRMNACKRSYVCHIMCL